MQKRNRGKAPNDHKIFNSKYQSIFYEAVNDLSFLLSRGYGNKSSLQIVGNRYKLNGRQQKALIGMSASNSSVLLRKKKEVLSFELKNKTVIIDGFNLLIILESALSGAFLFKGLDGAYRDVTSVHGGYKRVLQTEKAIELIGQTLQLLNIKKAIWFLDAPISNSGRLKTLLRIYAEQNNFNWEIHLSNNPDKELISSNHIMITSDAWILEEGQEWFNFIGYLIQNQIIHPDIIYSQKAKKIILVTCVKEKLNEAAKAIELYRGPLFKKFIDLANTFNSEHMYILSGKYGLLYLDDLIEPYDVNLNHQPISYQEEWATKVLEDLTKTTDLLHDEFIFITSKSYAKNIIPHLKKYQFPIEIE